MTRQKSRLPHGLKLSNIPATHNRARLTLGAPPELRRTMNTSKLKRRAQRA